ncbi:choice-of-anchor D domain-containing protein, partial [Maricaulaceae bacterium EIL42A08]|nr:choice-of-anchor D domain-containing protein [Maricaulaceae bacterium EIL42A08]
MAISTDLKRTNTTVFDGLRALAKASLAALAGGVLLSGAAMAQPLLVGPATASDITPSSAAPGDLEPGDTISLGLAIVTQNPSFDSFDGSDQIWNGQQLIGMSTSVDISVLGSGGVVAAFSGTASLNSNPNCNGTGPSLGSTSASWSGMSLVPSSFAASCTVAADIKLPDDIPPGTYTLVFDNLDGFYQPIQSRVGSGGTTTTTTGGTTAFSTAIASLDITVVADTTGPSGTITAPAGPVAPGEVFSASIVFDEPIVGFDSSDISVGNGTLSNFVAITDESGAADSFTFDVTAGTVGTVTIDVAAAAGQDAAGNDNTVLTQATTTVAGELQISSTFLGDAPEPGDTTTLRFTIQNTDDTETGTITFFTSNIQESLTGLAVSGAATTNTCGSAPSGTTFLVVTGGSVAPGSSCLLEFDVVVPGGATPGTYGVTTSNLSYSYPVAGAGISDTAVTQLTVAGAEGAGAPLAFSKSFTDDPVLPGGTVTLEYTIVPEEGTDASSLAFTDDLDAALSGLVATGLPQSDVCGTGSTLSGTSTISLSGGNVADGATCTFSVTLQTPTGTSGDFVSSTSELTGNQDGGSGAVAIDTGAIASDTLTLINQVPQVVQSGPAGPVAVGEGFTLTVEFSEPVTGFVAGDLIVTNGSASNLQTSDNETFTVTITPAAAGTVTVELPAGVAEDTDTNGNVAATDYTVEAETAAPEIEVQFVGSSLALTDGSATANTATGTDFGVVDVTTGSLTRTLRITNSGVGALSVTSIALTDTTNFGLTAALPTSVAGGGGTLDVPVTFDPTSVATFPATITINSDDADEAAFDFAISGEGGAAPEINVTGNSVNIADGDTSVTAADHTQFDTIDVSATGTRTFTIENLGGSVLTLGSNAVSITNDASGVFSVSAQPATTVAASGSETFTVQFTPSDVGTFTGLVNIASDDASENPYTFAIEATATGAPEVDLQGNGVSIVSGDVTPAVADDTSFEGVAVGSNASATFTIRNTGNDELVLTPPGGGRGDPVVRGAGSTDFTVTAQPGLSIAAGGSEAFSIQYAPSAVGVASATFQFGTNDDDEATYSFTVGGEGTAPEINLVGADGTTAITNGDSSPDAAKGTDFFSVGVSTGSETITLTIANEGSGLLTLGANAVSSSDPTQFAISSQPATTVASGGTTTFDITFDPTTVAFHSALISIANDDADENPYTFIVQGNGSDDIAPSGYTVAFDQDPVIPSNEASLSFTFAGAEVGADYDYSISSSGGGTDVTGTGTIATATDQITGIDVSGLGDGTLTLSATLTDSNSNEGVAATDTASKDTVPPAFTASFAPSAVLIGDVSTLTFGIDASSNLAASSALDFTNNLPSGLEVATVPNASSTCTGGTLTAVAGSGTISYTGGTVSAGASCAISVDVTPTNTGSFANTSGDLTSSYGNSGTASDTLTVTQPALSIADVTVNEGDGTASFTVSLSAAPAATTTVDFATSDGTAEAGSDYTANSGTVTFVAGETSQTISVAITDDTADEPTPETFTVTLSNPANATIADGSATGSINDNDNAPEISIADASVAENGGTVDFAVTLSNPSASAITVDFATADGTAIAGSDYVTTSGTLTFNPGDTADTITVTITDDGVVEPSETFTVDLSGATNSTIVDGSATGTITNDDAAPVGYTASFDADPVNNAGASATSFTLASAVVGTTYDFTISSDGGGTPVTGSGSVTSAGQQVSGIDVSGLGDGTLTLSVTLTDGFGNEGVAATDTAQKETGLPAVAITTTSADPVSGVFSVTFTFDEAVTGFAVGDITVGNGSAGNFAGSGDTYTADITPAADGTVTVDVAAGVAQDAAGNDNTAATQFSIESDGTAPGVVISTASADPVSGVFSVT